MFRAGVALINNSPDDGHMAARNVWRIEINIYEKLCAKLVIYKNHTKMNGQQNLKFKTILEPTEPQVTSI